MNPPEKNLEELYKVAVNTRQFEIQLFWQRSNYFLVLNTAIAVGFFARAVTYHWHSLLLAVFGCTVSVFWYRVNLGSRYWHVRWEVATQRMEQLYSADADLFAAEPSKLQDDVR